MNKALWAIIAAAALGATKKATSKGKIGSFNDELSDKDIFELVGRLNGIQSIDDFMALSADERTFLGIQAGYIIKEASSNPNSILAQRQTITVEDIKVANRNKGFRKNIQDVAIRKANKYIESLQQQRSFKQFSRTSPTRQKIQRQRSKPQQMADSILAPLSGPQRGMVDSLFLSKDYVLNPEAFVSFIRLMCGAWSEDYLIFPSLKEGEEMMILSAGQDSFEYNPLTDEYGQVTSSWARNALDKMVFLQETANSISITTEFSVNQQSIRYAYLQFYQFCVDQELFDRLIARWKAANGKLNSIIMKELHFLVFGTMYKLSKDYLDSEFFSFFFFSDISGQTILPFGNCNLESYKEIINHRSNGTYEPSYKYDRFITGDEDPIEFIGFDGMGALFDRLVYNSWIYTINKVATNEEFRQNVSVGGDIASYFKFQQEGNSLSYGYKDSSVILNFSDEMTYKIDGDYPDDEFSSFTLWFKSDEFRGQVARKQPYYDLFKEQKVLYSVFGLPATYGEIDPIQVKTTNFFQIENRLLRLGVWASECCLQLTKVINSGQIGLALYLLSPIIDFDVIDTVVSKYNIPLSMYPSNIKKKITKQQKDAIKKNYVTPEKAYFKGTEKIKPIRDVIGYLFARIKEKGVIGNVFSDELNLPMNFLLWKYLIIPEADMDFAKAKKPLQKRMIKKSLFRHEPGVNDYINGTFIPYYIFEEDDDKQKSKALMEQKKRSAKAAQAILEQSFRLNIVSRGDGNTLVWLDETRKNEYQNQKIIEAMSGTDNELYEKLDRQGKVYSEDDYHREESYKKFYTDQYMKTLDIMVRDLSRRYSVDTKTISSAPFNRIVGLFFGGKPSELTGAAFENYYSEKVIGNRLRIPTQSLTYAGMDMVPTIRGLNSEETRKMEAKIASQREQIATRIAEGEGREGSLEGYMLDFIDKSLKQQSIFGVPYISRTQMSLLTGIDFKKYSTSESKEEITLFSRDGEVENLDGFFPTSKVDFAAIPQTEWGKRYEVDYKVQNYVKIIQKAQSILIGSLLQELFTRFSTENVGDIGVVDEQTHALKFYTKVKKVGDQLALLGDDPLGFREMYRSLAHHSTSLDIAKVASIQIVFDPSTVKNKQLAQFSQYTENQIALARKIIRMPSIQKLLNDHFCMEINGQFSCKNSPQPLQKAILDIIGVFAILDERTPNSRSELTKDQIKEFFTQYDLFLKKVLDNIEKTQILVGIYDTVYNRYGLDYIPVAEYSDMDVKALRNILRRYNDFGPYRSFYGAEENYPQTFTELVARQLKAYEQFKTEAEIQTVRKESNKSYQDLDKRFQDSLNSIVAKQAEKLGALVSILPVGQGYRVYLPYTVEHIRNVARAGTKGGQYSKIADITDSLPYHHVNSVYCIADPTQENNYIIPWKNSTIMHLVIVSPDGKLHSLMTLDFKSNNAPSEIQQWRANVSMPANQPRIMDGDRYRNLLGIDSRGTKVDNSTTRAYYTKNFGLEPEEVLEIDSKIVREFGKFLNSWLQNPKTLLGEKIPNTTVEGSNYSWTDRASADNWTVNSKLLGLIKSRSNQKTQEDVDLSIDIGVLDNFPETKGGYYSNLNINQTLGDIDAIKKIYEGRMSTTADAISRVREARIDNLKTKRKL